MAKPLGSTRARELSDNRGRPARLTRRRETCRTRKSAPAGVAAVERQRRRVGPVFRLLRTRIDGQHGECRDYDGRDSKGDKTLVRHWILLSQNFRQANTCHIRMFLDLGGRAREGSCGSSRLFGEGGAAQPAGGTLDSPNRCAGSPACEGGIQWLTS
jgi:hypothetical protein